MKKIILCLLIFSFYLKIHSQHDHSQKAATRYHKILEKHPNSSLACWDLMKVYKASKQPDHFRKARLQFEDVTRYGDRAVFNSFNNVHEI